MTEKGIIRMSQRELLRLHVIHQIIERKIKQMEAAIMLKISERQIRRIVKRVKEEGDEGIIHRLRGEKPENRIGDGVKERVISTYEKKYKGFGPTFAVEKLEENEKIKISDETLRKWLIANGMWQTRRVRKHRQWRKRRSCYGEMEQMDGSHHDWFEGRGPKCVLMGYIDDATNKRYSRFYEYEGVKPAMDSLKRYIKKKGIPFSIYLDKHSTYKSQAKPTIEDELNNRKAMSQFERACAELGINVIHANSAAAKGRIERDFRIYQDRLIKEMRLRNISSIEEANKYLPIFLNKHNKRFKVKAEKEGDLHRPVPEDLDLDSILSIKEERVLRNDFTISYEGKFYQITDKINGRKVTVEERLNGRMYITYKGKRLKYKEIEKPQTEKKVKISGKARLIHRPPMEHPFKSQMYERRLAYETARKMAQEKAAKESELVLSEV
jgi:hypothetical protein